MDYGIFFDESNKLDQPIGLCSYYGAFGAPMSVIEKIIATTRKIKTELRTESELHFVEYRHDKDFEKYFKILNFVLEQDIEINLMIVNKSSAKRIADKMSITLEKLRDLFYVKIPERLFYGLTRKLKSGQQISIIIDENSEYEKIGLETKLREQMNAHSAYRKKVIK